MNTSLLLFFGNIDCILFLYSIYNVYTRIITISIKLYGYGVDIMKIEIDDEDIQTAPLIIQKNNVNIPIEMIIFRSITQILELTQILMMKSILE